MSFQHLPASAQGPLAIGALLCDLTFRDDQDRPVSLYDNRLFDEFTVILLIFIMTGQSAERDNAKRPSRCATVTDKLVQPTVSAPLLGGLRQRFYQMEMAEENPA